MPICTIDYKLSDNSDPVAFGAFSRSVDPEGADIGSRIHVGYKQMTG
jgi:hypothetical protein